ncbi:MAG: class I SAM-dependent methyltransferase [Syntrophales bacterium]|jgi:SAM-dependent methyltransferase|nr:class I SAM-dependent methyltransferase [Syntrophales bacterium]
MKSPDFSRKVKQSVAANFDQSFAIYQDFEDKHHLFAEMAGQLADWVGVRPGSAVLDLGCGSGISARVLCERYGCRVLGIDLSPKMVEAGQKRLGDLEDVRLVVGDGEAPGTAAGEERFDYVLYNASIFVFPDVAQAVREAAQCLKAGGEMAFSFYPLLVGPQDEDLLDEAFRRTGYTPPKFRVIASYEATCRALAEHKGPVSHYRWVQPLDIEFLKDFFSIPAQSSSLFPGLDYEERRNRACSLFDSLADVADGGSVVWRMAKA